jgi:type VI secretion system secreted protein VgrG
MTIGYTQANTYLSLSTPFGADNLLLRAFRGEETLSAPFHFSLDMLSETADLDFSTIVGKGVTISITASGGTTRYLHGIMTRFVQAGTSSRLTAYFGEIRPWFWLLTLASDQRIYQAKTTLEIVKALFGELGFSDFRDATTGTYTARDYCVQYNETAFDFVSRLLEEEGIHYFFEHADGKHTMVLADDSDAHTALASPTAVKYVSSGRDRVTDDIILSLTIEQQVIPNKYALDDYEFTTPATDLAVSVDGTDDGLLKLYDYPGGFSVKDRGEALAKLRIESHEAEAKILRGDSSVRTFLPGYTFALTDHPRSDVNATYLLRTVSHSATTDEYGNRFEAIPSTVAFRPKCTTRKPRIHSQTAIVVGKAGEEIWTDSYGRVKVQFHWDQKGTNDENSSCWIRVSQGWAGKAWGTLFTPRIGTEVIVSYVDGDPDRPLVTGTVYNATQTVPYTLPDDQTKSTIKTMSSKTGTAGNELRFEDKKDSEELYLHAQKDMTVLVENDRNTTVTNADTLTVSKANKSVTVSKGDESLTVTEGKRTITVTAGDETHTVGGKRTLKVTGDSTHTNEAKFTHNVTGDYTLKIDGNLTIEAGGTISIKSGTTFANEAGTAMTNKAGSDLTNEATSALKNKGMTVASEATTELTNKGVTVTNDASGQLNNKAGGMQNVEASGMLVLKGSLVKIN